MVNFSIDAEREIKQGFKYYEALSVEALAERLAKDLSDVQKDPMAPEIVLVTNRAQGAWLRQVISRKNGICANVEFLLLDKFISDKLGKKQGGANDDEFDPFALEPLSLKIFNLLRETKDEKDFYFSFRENRDEDLIVVAYKLAEVFKSYQSLRPEMIKTWQCGDSVKDVIEDYASNNGEEEFLKNYREQKKLWKKLEFKSSEVPAIRYLGFLSGNVSFTDLDLPSRIFVFAPSVLPNTHFNLLRTLSKRIRVFFYYHKLSMDLWTELEDARTKLNRLSRELEERGKTEEQKEILRSEIKEVLDSQSGYDNEKKWDESACGNELLLLWGRAARPLARTLLDESFLDSTESGGSNGLPGYDTLLHAMQSEIRRAPDTTSETLKKKTKEDESLLVHVAPSTLREVEILYDDMVRLFASDDTLHPRDVLIMFPNVDEYAPLVHLVFSRGVFPYTVADKMTLENFPGISAFFAILRIATGEARVTEILELLESGPVLRKLGLSTDDVSVLQEFLRKSNAHWGLSSEHRRTTFLSANDSAKTTENAEKDPIDVKRFFTNNSLDFGMLRGALGVMLGDDTESKKPLSFGDLEISVQEISSATSEMAELLGKFSKLLNGLKDLRKVLLSDDEKTCHEWCNILQDKVLDGLLDIEDRNEVYRLQSALNEIRDTSDHLGVKCNLQVVVKILESRSWEQAHNLGRLRGKLTFCSLQPLRNIPARVIYVAGMSWGKFPRESSKSSIDLVSNWPTAKSLWTVKRDNWDTTAREKDNLMLLEILLSAKDYLRFSYVASHKEKSPPAPALAKLIENADKLSWALGGHIDEEEVKEAFEGDVKKAFGRNHRLNPSDDDESFSQIALEEHIENLSLQNDKTLREAHTPLTENELKRFKDISMEDLVDFFVEPAKFVCKKRLNLRDNWRDNPLSDEDPNATDLEPRDKALEVFATASKLATKPTFISLADILCDVKRAARSRGEISAFTRVEHEHIDVSGEIKVLSSILGEDIASVTPWGKLVSPSSELPSIEVEVQKESGEIELRKEKIKVFASFENVFKSDNGETVFVMFPKKKSSEWAMYVSATIAAALIVSSEKREEFGNFRVVASDGKKKIAQVTLDSLNASGLTLEWLVKDFFKGLTADPPLLFGNTPIIKKKGKEDEKEKVEKYYEDATKELLKLHYSGEKNDNSPKIAPEKSLEMRLVFGRDLSENRKSLLEASFALVKAVSIAVDKFKQ